MTQIINKILKDYERYCIKQLKKEFIRYKPSKLSPIVDYQRFKYRTISVKPRRVVEPSNLVIPDRYQLIYNKIVSDIVSGEPLRKYQSKKLKNEKYNDDMLSHWKIQHFHLGDSLGKDGFVKRSGDLLFVYLKEDCAYIIGFYQHGSWCDIDIIEVIHNNWPKELIEFKSEKKSKSITQDEYKRLRANGYNTTIVVSDGTEYFGPGFGVVSGGCPATASAKALIVKKRFMSDFDLICENFDCILSSGSIDVLVPDIVSIGLEMNDLEQRFVYVIREINFKFTLN